MLDASSPYYRLILGNPVFKTMKAILNFCGIKPVKRTYFEPIEISSEKQKNLD